MNKIIKILFLLLAIAGNSAYANQALRIAFVNIPEILEQAPQADAVRETLNNEFAPRDLDLAAGDKKLDFLKQKLEQEAATLGEEELRKLEREVLTQEREMKRSHEEYLEDRNIRKNEELTKMQREIRLSIVTLAKGMGFDLVIESGVMYASERVDITSVVIERLKLDFLKKANTNK